MKGLIVNQDEEFGILQSFNPKNPNSDKVAIVWREDGWDFGGVEWKFGSVILNSI